MRDGAFDASSWPWENDGIRVLPILHGRLEFARAVRAHLDAWVPDAIVVEVPHAFQRAWLDAVARLPAIHALRVEAGDRTRWLVVEPTDAAVEAARWASDRGARIVAGDLFDPDYPERSEAFPDPAVIPEIGYKRYAEAWIDAARIAPDSRDAVREQALAAAALEMRASVARVVLVCGLAHLPGVMAQVRAGARAPFVRKPHAQVHVVPIEGASLGEVLSEMPFVASAWEHARAGNLPCTYCSPQGKREPGRVLRFPGARAAVVPEAAHEDPDDAAERAAKERGDDLLARPRLLFRLVQHAVRFAHETSGSEPTLAERRVLHRFAASMATLRGRLCPDLYELVVAARGSVDDSFARDMLRVATAWPWAEDKPGAVRLRARDLGHDTRLVTLRPKIDRISRRPSLADALSRMGDSSEQGPVGICSHVPEDLVIEGLGGHLRRIGGARASRAGIQIVPFTASLLDGVDARETLRRFIVDGRPWVRDEVSVRAEVGAVVIVFDEDRERDDGFEERFPWCQVWHGEHQNESDMAFYATDPGPGLVAPGIHRAEYGGLLMVWPPLRLGDVWHDDAYAFCRSKSERLLVGALDYARSPLVVYVARERPRNSLLALAGRLGRRVVHVPPGTLSRDLMRRVRIFHVLADKRLRPIAEALIDPT